MLHDQIKQILDTPISLDFLSEIEKKDLLVKGILYSLENDLSDEECLEIIKDFLSVDEKNDFTDGLIHLLIKKTKSANNTANYILFNYLLHHPESPYFEVITSEKILPLNEKQHLLINFYLLRNEISFSTENFLSNLTDFFINENEKIRLTLFQKAEILHLINWIKIAACIHNPKEENFLFLIENFNNFSTHEKNLVGKVFLNLGDKDQKFIDGLYKIYNFSEEQIILNKIKQLNKTTEQPEQLALFLLLTEQWDEYEKFDFDNSYLKKVFLGATANQRQKILFKTRLSGKFSWLNDIAGQKKLKWVSDLSTEDWTKSINYLIAQDDHVGLIRLLNILPPVIAKTVFLLIIEKLSVSSDFDLKNDPIWENLLYSVKNLPNHFPQMEIINQKSALSNQILSSTISHNEKQIYIGLATNEIIQVDLSTLKQNFPSISMVNGQTRSINTDQADKILILAQGDHQIRFVRISDKQIIKNMPGHSGYIKKIVLANDNKTLYSCGFDGKLISWRFPEGSQLGNIQISEEECFDLGLTFNNKTGFVVDSKGILYIFHPNTLKIIKTIEVSNAPITSTAVSSKQPLVVMYDNSEKISLWNIESGAMLKEKIISSPKITSILFSDQDDFLICGDIKGGLSAYSLHDFSLITSMNFHKSPVINIHKVNNNKFVVIFRDGTICLVDFQLLNAIFTPINLFNNVDFFKTKFDENKLWVEFINKYYRFIHRYDILIDENRTIHLGEFDIQIE